MWVLPSSSPILDINSKAVSRSPHSSRVWLNKAKIGSSWGKATKTVVDTFGAGKSFNTALVIIPNVPSAPTKSCFKSYPVLSLRNALNPFQISPLGSTTSKPRTKSRVLPYLRTLTPPAFVDKFPPIRQLPSAPKLNGNRHSFSAAAFCKLARMQPDSAVIVLLSGST